MKSINHLKFNRPIAKYSIARFYLPFYKDQTDKVGGFMYKNSGFTLIELLMVIALIGILSSIAIPSYQKYTRKAYYVEIIQAAQTLKLAVEECYQLNGGLDKCHSGGDVSIPTNPQKELASNLIKEATISGSGVITIVPKELHGFKKSDTYILTPKILNQQLNWQTSGGAVDAGYVLKTV